MSPPELITPELNTPSAANNTPTILTKDLNEHIDIQINKALAPFISKLSTLIKEHEQLSAENKFVRDINNGIPTIHRRQFSVDNSSPTIHRRKILRRKIHHRKIHRRKIHRRKIHRRKILHHSFALQPGLREHLQNNNCGFNLLTPSLQNI